MMVANFDETLGDIPVSAPDLARPLDELHTFVTVACGGDQWLMQIMRRIDLHESKQVAALHITDGTIQFKHVAERFCRFLDDELKNRKAGR